MRRYICGVPNLYCSGGNSETPVGIMKCHQTPDEAFRCKCRYLTREGYVRIGSREFTKGDGPVLVLPKKTHFGGVLRGGKREKGVGSRGTFQQRHGGCVF